MHYQYPNNDPEFFNGHSPNEQVFHQLNGENPTSIGKDFFFKVKGNQSFI
jgi:hypothetical protein